MYDTDTYMHNYAYTYLCIYILTYDMYVCICYINSINVY